MKIFSLAKLKDYALTHSAKECAEKFNISYSYFFTIAKRFNIEYMRIKAGRNKTKPNIRQQDIMDYYKNHQITLSDLGKMFNYSPQGIWRLLNRYGIDTSSPKEKLLDKYLKSHEPIVSEISKNTGLSKSWIRALLSKKNISTVAANRKQKCSKVF